MKALIVEDEKSIAETIEYLLQLYFPEFEEIHHAANVESAKTHFNRTGYDILFLDVKLGEKTSFDFLGSVNAMTTPKIFISGHENFMKDAFKQNTVDFILKPIDTEEFKETVQRAVRQVESLSNNKQSFQELQQARITIADMESIHLLQLSNINYLEADGPYTIVYLEDGSKLTFSKHMKEFEDKLGQSGFFRTHKSFMVNTVKVKSILKKDGLQVFVDEKQSVPLSSRKKEDFFAFMKKHFEI